MLLYIHVKPLESASLSLTSWFGLPTWLNFLKDRIQDEYFVLSWWLNEWQEALLEMLAHQEIIKSRDLVLKLTVHHWHKCNGRRRGCEGCLGAATIPGLPHVILFGYSPFYQDFLYRTSSSHKQCEYCFSLKCSPSGFFFGRPDTVVLPSPQEQLTPFDKKLANKKRWCTNKKITNKKDNAPIKKAKLANKIEMMHQ